MKTKPDAISVIGLGYVGLPLAVEFARHFHTIGFDVQPKRIDELLSGYDKNGEMSDSELKQSALTFTCDPQVLKQANFHIVAVPTPIDEAHQPDLRPLEGATDIVGKILKRGDIVVYESTVYPGVTEEICVPILEKVSGLKCGRDFKIGYSPERINPGDRHHSLQTVVKVVSGQDAETLETVADIYGTIVKAGVFKAASVKVAEAAKVIENIQRDLNIALMNELAMIFNRMGIDTHSVLEAASTKWNFLKFSPGLVGGHCIGVDPYYLTHKAERMNYIPQVILAGRRINDGMGRYVARKTVKEMIHLGHPLPGSTVTVLGLSFKENVRDLRNTRVAEVVKELENYGAKVQVCDPLADPDEARHEYGFKIVPFNELSSAEAVVLAVAHEPFKKLTAEDYKKLMKDRPLIVDVKSILDVSAMKQAGIAVWRL